MFTVAFECCHGNLPLPLQLPTTPTMDDFNTFVRHFRSDSDGSVIITDDNGQPIDIIRQRPRARSLRYEGAFAF